MQTAPGIPPNKNMDNTEINIDQPTEKAPFVIDTADRADWVLGKLANIRAEQARIKANAEKRIAELEADYNQLNGRFGAELEAWAKGESIARRRKTVTLLNGSIAFRAVPERLAVENLQDAMQTARLVCPGAIVEVPAVPASEKLDTAALIKHATATLQDTGEILIGLKLLPADESVKITPGSKNAEE